MKTTLSSALCLTVLGAGALLAQPSFTKIAEGPLVTDLGVSPVCPAWGDLNNDGYLDLVVVDRGLWVSTNDYTRAVQMIYLNSQDGIFRRATESDIGPIANTAVAGLGPMSLADYDNDGYLDIYLCEGIERDPEKAAYLYRGGPDGRFTLVGEDAGINRPLGPWLPGGYYPFPWGVSWVDYDEDGLLDIYLTTAWIADNTVDQLWRNNGNGTFSRVLANVFNRVFDSNFGCWADYDNDGDPDVLVGGYRAGTAQFYRNEGHGQFTDITTSLGLSFGYYGAWGDYDNDGRLDLFAVTGLFWNDGAGHFTSRTGADYPSGGGGGANNWIDFDNDGYLDFFSTSYTTNRRCMMRNNRDGTFREVNLGDLTDDPAGWLAGWADFDNDGFLDVVVPSGTNWKFNELYHNDGNENHWLLIKPVGTRSNRSGIGAKVRTQATIWGKGVQQMREISGTPYAGDPRAHFGLGDATNVTTLRIEWPSGTVQEYTNVAADQILTVWELPALSAAVRADGTCELTIKAEPNLGWQIKASADLLHWQTLTTVTNTGVTFQFTDTAAAGMEWWFYRVEGK
jgi:enediyne biosynthesis protein E4